ncbi:MAG: DNA replication/repair protein RecF [Candidatus Peribacteria bacterium]|jgi:DNA replication and repair protein RecF|nr:DNA replication/repair protein RecF [Candidatus Peribacteria bacterium]
MDKSYISEIILNNFRNYSSKKVNFNDKYNIIIGNNGVGKTNILEALSLFSNSRGLRNATNEELGNLNRSCPFLPEDIMYSLSLRFFNDDKINLIQKNDKKILKINDEIIKKMSFLNNFLNITFLTPQMDSFFTDTSTNRRKFLDKTAEILFNEHCENVKKYEFFVKERMKILLEQHFDEKWLDIIEKKIAELGVNIAGVRNEVIELLNKIFVNFTNNFPTGEISIAGEIEEMLMVKKSIEVEEFFLRQLRKNRLIDAQSKRFALGIHRSDMLIFNSKKNMKANLCSTGEQKMLLISLIFVKCIFSKQYGGGTPILLLDEICSHLDEETKNKFFEELKYLAIQTFITGIRREDFTYLTDNFIEL